MSRTALLGSVALTAICVTLALSSWIIGRWAGAQAPVPDHANVFSGTNAMVFAGQTTLAQRIVPRGNRILAVDVLLAAENAGLPGDVQLEIVSLPERATLRRARMAASGVPVGQVWRVRPGEPAEQWTTFGFDPIDGIAGKDLLAVLSYADGRDQPGHRLVTLAHFPGKYPDGELYVNDLPVEGKAGDLLFRAARDGTRSEAIGVALANLTRVQPVARGSLALPAALAALCAALAACVAGSIARPSPAARAIDGRQGGGQQESHTVTAVRPLR
ncbi:MAG: hypothetical protein ACR2NO_11325 [Chloroflexota bacterium]